MEPALRTAKANLKQARDQLDTINLQRNFVRIMDHKEGQEDVKGNCDFLFDAVSDLEKSRYNQK
jgi:hypothetical protein